MSEASGGHGVGGGIVFVEDTTGNIIEAVNKGRTKMMSCGKFIIVYLQLSFSVLNPEPLLGVSAQQGVGKWGEAGPTCPASVDSAGRQHPAEDPVSGVLLCSSQRGVR